MDIGLTWNDAVGFADVSVIAGDFTADQGLVTSAIVALFTDRQAEPGDVIPDGTDDPRGWWGDAYAVSPSSGNAYLIGSRLWLLDRAVITRDTLIQAQDYVLEALQWMIDDGIVGAVGAVATAIGISGIGIAVTLDQAGSQHKFNFAWSNS